MQGNRSHYRVLMSAGRRADVVSLRSRGPIKGLMPQRPCWGRGGGSSVRDGEGVLGNSKRLSPLPFLAPRPARPRLAHYLTRYEQRLAGPYLFCLCVGAGLGGEARLMGETPSHPAPHLPPPRLAAPAPARPRHAQHSQAWRMVPCQLPGKDQRG